MAQDPAGEEPEPLDDGLAGYGPTAFLPITGSRFDELTVAEPAVAARRLAGAQSPMGPVRARRTRHLLPQLPVLRSWDGNLSRQGRPADCLPLELLI